MIRRLGLVALLAVLLAAPGSPAQAQRGRPRGGTGFSGWSAPPRGRGAAGAGIGAAGAGSYNTQTADARSTNADTAMRAQNYHYNMQKEKNRDHYARLAAKGERTRASADDVYRRLHDNPEPRDVHSGDALNVVLDELSNPMVYMQSVEQGTRTITSRLVKTIPFNHASAAVTLSLDRFSAQGAPEVLRSTPAFEPDRQAFRAVVAQARAEAEAQGQISAATLAKARAVIQALQSKVAGVIPPNTPVRRDADNYLKALSGLTTMLEMPDVAAFLKGLDTIETTTLGHLLSFMHTFHLRFGAAKTPAQEAAYDQLYPLLVALREQVQPPSAAPTASPDDQPDPRALTEFYSDAEDSRLPPPPGRSSVPAPAPPRPRLPR